MLLPWATRGPIQAESRRSAPEFRVALPIPPVLAPVRVDATTDYYEIVQREAWSEIIPGVRTRIWGYNGSFPGPTIKARRGRTTVVVHTNNLSIPTVVHLHGGVTRPDSDGFPTDTMAPGESRPFEYGNTGRPATLWYHDHSWPTAAATSTWDSPGSTCWRTPLRATAGYRMARTTSR